MPTTSFPFDTLPEAAVLSAPPAPVTPEQARAVLAQFYDLPPVAIRPLSGERDANFLVELTAPTPAWPPRLMLKISHPVEAPHMADFQTQALLHLARHAPALPVQRLLPMRDGAHAAVSQAVDGQARVVRLFSYLEGLPMPQAARSTRQQASVAQALARLDLALQGMAPHIAAGERMPWDIQRADSVRGLVAHLGSPERRALVEHALDRFEQHVLPRLAALRRQPIHNDFNIYNLLVDPTDTERVCGILDFGDMVEGPLVNDVAVAASYQLDERGDAPGALAAINAFAAAYHHVHPLRPEELDLLPDLIRARLAMVVCIGGWRAARNPANADYVLRNNQISWARLQACRPISHSQAQEALRLACPDPLPLH